MSEYSDSFVSQENLSLTMRRVRVGIRIGFTQLEVGLYIYMCALCQGPQVVVGARAEG